MRAKVKVDKEILGVIGKIRSKTSRVYTDYWYTEEMEVTYNGALTGWGTDTGALLFNTIADDQEFTEWLKENRPEEFI